MEVREPRRVLGTAVARWVAGAAAVLLVAGCGGDPGAPAAPTPTTAATSVSPTSSPTATTGPPSRIPEAARAETRDGAQAFAMFFLSELNRYFMDPQSNAIHDLFEKPCRTCAAFVDVGDTLMKNDRHNDGNSVEIEASRVLDFQGDTSRVLVRFSQNPVHVVDHAGKIIETGERAAAGFVFHLRWVNAGWTVTEIKSEARP